jgi:Bromodomain
MKWQIAGLAEPTIALFLSYSRHGHLNLIRRVAIESLIVISGLEKPEMVRYLAHLCIDDPDPFIRYVTSLAMMNFIAIACQQIQMSTSLDARKHTLKSQIKVMMEVWSPLSPELMDFFVYRYLAKIVDMVREILPEERDRLKYTLPIVYTEGEEEAVVPDVAQPTIKPLKLNFKALPTTVSPPKKTSGDRRAKILKKLMNHKVAYWFSMPVDPVRMGIPNYLNVIKHPMDFSTIKKRLNAGIYQGEEEFAADVRLIFSNSLLFNPPNSQVNTDAMILSGIFENEFGGVAVVEPIAAPDGVIATPAKASVPFVFKHLTAANSRSTQLYFDIKLMEKCILTITKSSQIQSTCRSLKRRLLPKSMPPFKIFTVICSC